MEKKYVNEQALNIDGTSLEAAMKAFMEDKKTENMAAFMQALKNSKFLVPVDFPKDLGEAVLAKMKKGEKITQAELPKMLPILLTNKKNERFAPAFTSKEQILEKNNFAAILPVGFGEIIRISKTKSYDIKGILLNPNGHNLILGTKMIDMMEKVMKGEDVSSVLEKEGHGNLQTKKISLTIDQFHGFVRRNVELGVLPKLVLLDKKTFLEKIDADGEQLLLDLYKEMYKANVPFPYEKNDFDVMMLQIRDDLTIISLGLPSKHVGPGVCSSAYVVWNPQTDDIQYFVVEHAKDKEVPNLGQVTSDGKYQVLKDAPSSGSEMSCILEMFE